MHTSEAAATPTRQTPTSVAAAALGVSEATLGVVRRTLTAPEAQAVGHVLVRLVDDDRVLASCTGSGVAAREVVPVADGEALGFSSALLRVPAGAVADREVVVRIHAHPIEWEYAVEAIGPAADLPALSATFHAFVDDVVGTGSPLRGGSYQVFAGEGGLRLGRYDPGSATRADLAVPDSVWEVVDRLVGGAVDLAPVLAAESLATSSGVLCVGPPGTGKSQLARIVATELHGRATVLVPRARCALTATR